MNETILLIKVEGVERKLVVRSDVNLAFRSVESGFSVESDGHYVAEILIEDRIEPPILNKTQITMVFGPTIGHSVGYVIPPGQSVDEIDLWISKSPGPEGFHWGMVGKFLQPLVTTKFEKAQRT